jgi:prophage regulatory protein
MSQVRSKKLLAAVGGGNSNLETVRLHWKKESSSYGLQPGDWLLIPFNPSALIAGGFPFSDSIAELASAVKALNTLRSWLKSQRTPFSLESAAISCFQIGRANLTSDIQAGLHLLLEDLGCTPFEKRTTTSYSWFHPPQPAIRVKTARDPPGESWQGGKNNPAPSHEIYRMGTVVKLSGLSRSSIYRLEALGLFPGRVKLAGSAVGWRSDEIHSWIASRTAPSAKEER